MTVRKESELKEIATAFSRALAPGDTMVSRQAIENEIDTNPGLYPLLSGMSARYIRYAITVEMNRRYSLWTAPTTGKKANRVWIVTPGRQAA